MDARPLNEFLLLYRAYVALARGRYSQACRPSADLPEVPQFPVKLPHLTLTSEHQRGAMSALVVARSRNCSSRDRGFRLSTCDLQGLIALH